MVLCNVANVKTGVRFSATAPNLICWSECDGCTTDCGSVREGSIPFDQPKFIYPYLPEGYQRNKVEPDEEVVEAENPLDKYERSPKEEDEKDTQREKGETNA